MKSRLTLGSLVFLVVLGLFGIFHSLSFDYTQAKILPFAMSSVIFVLAAIELGRQLLRKEVAPKPGEAEEKFDWRRFGLVLGFVSGVFLAIVLFGFTITIPFCVLAYLRWQRRNWPTSVGFAVITLAAIYGMFELALRTQLYKGLVFGG